MKNIFLALSMFLTIVVTMFMWGVFNAMGVPNEDPRWGALTFMTAIGLFVICPLTIAHLLRTRDYLPPKKK